MESDRSARPTVARRMWIVAAALLLAALCAFVARWHWTLELTTHFTALYAGVAGLLVVGFAAAKKRWGVVAAAALLALHGWRVVEAQWQVEGRPQHGGTAIRLLLLNVHGENTRYGDTLRLIRAEDPDVVLLLETRAAWLAALKPLAATHPHRLSEIREDNFGVLLFSKLPLLKADILAFGGSHYPSIVVRLDLGEEPLNIVLTHAVPPVGGALARERDDQLFGAARHAASLGGRTVLAGDFNATPWSPIFRDVVANSGMRDSRRGFGLQGTWISVLPSALRIPIDHVLVTPDLEVTERRVGPDVGSDHRPVIVDMR